MSKLKKSVPVGIWKRFETNDLQITPSLAGMAHEFDHHGYRIKIELPSRPRQRDWKSQSSRIHCLHYRHINKRKYPVSYLVDSVDVYIETKQVRRIPSDSIGVVNHELFDSRQRISLDDFAYRYEVDVDSAFERWLDVIRWKSGIHTICPYHQKRQTTLWGPYLIDVSTNRSFYCPPYRLTATLLKSVTKRDWRVVQNFLEDNKDVPIWHLYVAEAYQKRALGDLRGFILDLAISIETIVRVLMKNYISISAAPAFEDAVGRISIMQILDKWVNVNLKNRRWKDLKSEIKLVKRVVVERNNIMHRGARPNFSQIEANEFAQAVLNFINAGEDQIDKYQYQ